MRLALGVLVVLFNLMDNATTFLCLRAPVPGHDVVEANPFAAWLFQSMGLVPGLAVETAITTAAVCFLVLNPRIPQKVRLGLLAVLAVLPAWAAYNNLQVMWALGIDWSVG